MVEFKSDEDVWEIIDLLCLETMNINKNEKMDFDIATSVKVQLPFFACSKAIFDLDSQKDIERYMYCKEYGIAPYPGSFEDQPAEWIEKTFIIKSAIAKKEKELYAKARSKN